MNVQPGCPVRSLAGHDKDQYYILLSMEGERFILADGRRRTLAKPKKKNRKHVQIDVHPLITDFPTTDEKIYSQLKNYRKCH